MIGGLNVSRETMERLELYLALLRKWNPKINLVAKSTLDDAWTRHIEDSVQVFALADPCKGKWFDIGSGGGFPGMVCAAIATELAPEVSFVLADSDQRKCAFLRTVAREMDIQVTVIASRIEEIEPQDADFVSARALASLKDLFSLAQPHLKDSGKMIFQKGRRWREEVREAEQTWRFHHEVERSKTDSEAVIMQIKELQHV